MNEDVANVCLGFVGNVGIGCLGVCLEALEISGNLHSFGRFWFVKEVSYVFDVLRNLCKCVFVMFQDWLANVSSFLILGEKIIIFQVLQCFLVVWEMLDCLIFCLGNV